jgi:hypothetical protein
LNSPSLLSVTTGLNSIGKDKKVSFLLLLGTRSWATSLINGLNFKIADTNKVHSWITNRSKGNNYFYNKHLFPNGLMLNSDTDSRKFIEHAAENIINSKSLEPFFYQYETNEEEIKKVWKSITI